MSATLDVLAREKEVLVLRSALCRLRLARSANDARASLPWNRAAATLAAAPMIGRIAFGLALSVAGIGRTARLVRLAGRIVLLAGLVPPAIAYARTLAGPRACAIEQTPPGSSRSLGHSPRSSP